MDTSLAALSNFTTVGDALSNLVQAMPVPAHLRDVKSGKYLLSNDYQARNNGFEVGEDIIGLTNTDLDAKNRKQASSVGHSMELENEYTREVDRINYQCSLEKHPVASIHFTQNNFELPWMPAGAIIKEKLIKVPIIYGPNKNRLAIFTLFQNLTPQTNLFDLYGLYKRYYQKGKAIHFFLKYLGIEDCFITLPTDAHVLTLLAMQRDPSAKYVARSLHIQPRTAEIHIRNLRAKIKHRDLPFILRLIRENNRSTLC